MALRDAAALAFKVLALLAVLMAIGPGAKVLVTMVLGWPYDSGGRSQSLMVASILAPMVLPLLASCVLWFGADRLAKKVVREGHIETRGGSSEAVISVSLSLVGIVVLAIAIPDLTKLIYYYWQLSTPGGVQIGTDVERRSFLIETTVRIVMGLALVFGSAGIANLLRRVRDR